MPALDLRPLSSLLESPLCRRVSLLLTWLERGDFSPIFSHFSSSRDYFWLTGTSCEPTVCSLWGALLEGHQVVWSLPGRNLQPTWGGQANRQTYEEIPLSLLCSLQIHLDYILLHETMQSLLFPFCRWRNWVLFPKSMLVPWNGKERKKGMKTSISK